METNSKEITLGLISAAREAQASLSFTIGVYYGYPTCCNMEYCNDVANGIKPNYRAIDNRGFIPCSEHYRDIKAGKTTLDELIKNRICKDKF